jgi:hypothetical protein
VAPLEVALGRTLKTLFLQGQHPWVNGGSDGKKPRTFKVLLTRGKVAKQQKLPRLALSASHGFSQVKCNLCWEQLNYKSWEKGLWNPRNHGILLCATKP